MLSELCQGDCCQRQFSGITSATMKGVKPHVYSMHCESEFRGCRLSLTDGKTRRKLKLDKRLFSKEVTRRALASRIREYTTPGHPVCVSLDPTVNDQVPLTPLSSSDVAICDFDGQREREHAGTGAGRQEHAATRHPG